MGEREALQGIAELLAPGEGEVAARVLLAYDNPEAYVREHEERLERRGIDEPIDELAWIALVDALADHRLLGEIDWKEAPEEIRATLDALATSPQNPWAWHDPEEDFPTFDFLERAGAESYAAGTALAVLDIESDCYPLVYLPAARAGELVELATGAGYRAEIFGR